ncbi:lymphatic vessel endothelial hyaluronic receptor 1b isoform X1 [Gambusia affinis]|uniref:lymphatic vessel endothelial hyaluronic receptor 1b isoform X1 n=1 Tax=Gambusia affinis TaxID=33528 RepID=UPI001CDC2F4C|nr:lymphatic vessel endothelial hyaluronic receptor 1b isoform X1 [Gambusia affinis]
MAGRFCFTSAFLLLFMLQLSASSLSKVVVQTDEPIGIFLLIDGGRYTLNFTEAQAACSFLKVTIATIAQMKEAVRHGLETCKYGWVAEKTAVVPRITSDKNCGKGNTGLVLWNTPPYSKFAVYCFNASALTDQNQTLDPSTATPQSPGSSTLPEALGPASSSAAPTSRSSTQSPPAVGNTSIPQPTEQAPSATASVTKATDLSSSSSPVKHLSSHIPASPHRLITSTPAGVTFSFPTSTQSPSLSVSSEPGLEPSVGSTRPLLDGKHSLFCSLFHWLYCHRLANRILHEKRPPKDELLISASSVSASFSSFSAQRRLGGVTNRMTSAGMPGAIRTTWRRRCGGTPTVSWTYSVKTEQQWNMMKSCTPVTSHCV